MHEYNLYTIPFEDKFIIYQPLNKFAFIGNQSVVQLIGSYFQNKTIDSDKYPELFSFLNSYGFFNQYNLENLPENKEYNPTVAVLCMTSACNFRCTYCFAEGGDTENTEMPVNIGKHAIDLAYQNAKSLQTNQFSVSFHGGGEPTLPFNKLKGFVQYSKKKDIPSHIELTSNGYWDEDKTNWIISNVDELTLSFDGLESVQNKQRPLADGGKTFETIFRNINRLDDSKLQYGIRLTVTNESVEYLVESIKFLCENTKCSTFQVEPAFAAGRALKNELSIKQNKKFIDNFLEAYDFARSKGRFLYYSGARPWVLTNTFCTAHDNALVVTPKGVLSSCYEISGNMHPLAAAFHFGKLTGGGKIENKFKAKGPISK